MKRGLLKLQMPLIILTALAMAITLSPFALQIQGSSQNRIDLVYEKGFIFYALISISILLVGLINMFLTLRFAEKDYKTQVKTIFRGLTTAVLLVGIANLVLPQLTKSKNINLMAGNASYIGVAAFIGTTFYAIIRHRLFDLHLFVVRTFAYIVSLAVLAGLFGIVVFGTAKLFFDIHIEFWAQAYISIGTSLMALGFSRLKAFFDRISNQLFYRDAYDTQTLLDNLNKLLVANTDVEQLLKNSAAVIADNFKAEFCLFSIRESDQMPQRIIGKGTRTVVSKDIIEARDKAVHLRTKLVIADELSSDYDSLQTVLRVNNVAILGSLTAATNTKSQKIGYLLLGSRRSGNPYNNKDIRTIKIIVNELVIAIENSLRFEQIQHFNETLQTNVSEATKKLRHTNEKLQGLDATKDEFISMASHQLRTPLTAVKGYLSMVLEGDAGPLNENQTKLLEQSYMSSQRMVYLIADLLNLSRLSTGKFVIESVSTNLVDVVQGEINQLIETARSRDVTLSFVKPVSFPRLMLDETKIRQVVMNFIDNAIYYTPAGGSIVVELHETAQNVEYTVKDTGMGVPRAEQRHLFSKFFRADNARKARPDGTGLGLFMAKKVVVAQGGVIIFESHEGKGSTFGFRFSKQRHSVTEGSTNREPAQIVK